MGEEYLHDEEVARVLGLTIGALRNKISAGDPLPPNALLPGLRTRIWPRPEFDQWVRKFLVGDSASPKSAADKSRKNSRK